MVWLPVIPGHEVGATIEAVGTDVPDFLCRDSMSPSILTRIAASAPPAGTGRVNACEHNETFGVQRDGTMTEFVAVPLAEGGDGRRTFRPRLCFGGTHERGLPCRVARPSDGHRHGHGHRLRHDRPLGLLSVPPKRAKVIAVDLDDEKLEVARSLGQPAFSILKQRMYIPG